jgi:hypothetical protein
MTEEDEQELQRKKSKDTVIAAIGFMIFILFVVLAALG